MFVRRALSALKLRASPSSSPPLHPTAAVAILLRKRREQSEILFVKRAIRERDAWSGDVAFPGGCRDASDADDFAAACREVREEIGLDLGDKSRYSLVGKLSEHTVRRGKGFLTIVPFVIVETRANTGYAAPAINVLWRQQHNTEIHTLCSKSFTHVFHACE